MFATFVAFVFLVFLGLACAVRRERLKLEKEKKWNLILVEYNKELGRIKGVATILKENITKDNIIPRNPLSKNARRAGWQGCNFKFNKSVVNFISKA